MLAPTVGHHHGRGRHILTSPSFSALAAASPDVGGHVEDIAILAVDQGHVAVQLDPDAKWSLDDFFGNLSPLSGKAGSERRLMVEFYLMKDFVPRNPWRRT
jgi:hypothetical protein